MAVKEFDESRQLIEQGIAEIKELLTSIDTNTKNMGGAGGRAGPGGAGGAGGGGSSALAGGFARRAGARGFAGKFGGALQRKLIGRAGGPVGALAAGAAGAIGAAVIDPARKIAKDTIFNGMRNAASFGAGVNPFQGAFNQAKKNIPIIGQGVSRVLDPLQRAASRTNAITSLIARGGGAISAEDRESIFDRFKLEEQRAQKETIEVQKLLATEIGSEETTNAVNEELSAQIGRLSDAITSTFGGG